MMTDRFFQIVAFAAALSAGATSFASAASERHPIASAALGRGTVTLWSTPGGLGVTIDRDALASLPAQEMRLDFPVAFDPYRLVEIDWHPHGHEPKGIYDVPHFDAHFYVISKSERDAIAFAPPGSVAKPDASIVPEGYTSDGTVVPQMGMHFVSAAQPEFHGRPFMCSQLFGYNAGHLAFVEAMFSVRFVTAHASFAEPIAKTAHRFDGMDGTMSVVSNEDGGYDVALSR